MTTRRMLAAAIIAAAGTGTAIADVTFQPIMMTGEAPPEIDPLEAATISGFDSHFRLGEGGHVNLEVMIEGPSIGSNNNRVHYVGLPGALTKYYRNGDPFPPLSGVFFSNAPSSTFPSVPNRSGHLVTQVQLSGQGVDDLNDSAVFLWDGSQHTLVMREGDPAPGFDPFLGLTIPSLTPQGIWWTDDGRFVKENLYFLELGGTVLNPPTARYVGTPASPTLVVEPLAPVPGLPDELWYAAGPTQSTSAGTCFTSAVLQGGEVTYWTGDPESPSLLMRDGDPVPGLAPGNVSILGNSRAVYDINDAAEALFIVELAEGFGDTTDDNDTVMLFGTAGNLVVVAREGDEVPGLPGVVFQDFVGRNPPTRVVSGDDRIGLFVTLTGAGVTTANDEAILIGQPGALRVVLREGDPAPGYPAGYTLAGSTNFNPGDMVGFSSSANYAINVDVLDDTGVKVGPAIYAGDPVTGDPVLVVGAGSMIEVAPGDGRTVGSMTNDLSNMGRTLGNGLRRTALLNAQNQFLFTARFTDGTQAALLATITDALFAIDVAPTVDDSSGNGDGLLDPAESGIMLTIPIRNISEDPTTGVSATLTSMTPTATVVSGSSTYADLGAGASGTNASSFEIAIDPSHPCGGSVELQLTVVSNEGSTTFPFFLQGGESYAGCPVTFTWEGDRIDIPDNDPVGISVDVEVSGLSSSLCDVDVVFGLLAHGTMGDLIITLTSPQGTSVVILNQQGGTENHLRDAVFDDEALAPFPACPSTHGCSHQPFSPLSAFDGEDPNGTWTLHVADVVAGTTGSLRPAFSLMLSQCVTDDCLADLDGSGGVDAFDLLAYLDLWFDGDAAAELTGDDPASIDVFDLLAYLDSWFMGC